MTGELASRQAVGEERRLLSRGELGELRRERRERRERIGGVEPLLLVRRGQVIRGWNERRGIGECETEMRAEREGVRRVVEREMGRLGLVIAQRPEEGEQDGVGEWVEGGDSERSTERVKATARDMDGEEVSEEELGTVPAKRRKKTPSSRRGGQRSP